VTQLERTTQSVTGMVKQADELTRRVSRDAEEGGVSVERAMQGFSRVRDSVTESAKVIREMGRRASDISTIVSTIDLIAERTNLLSLNASIEAARAGDAGRGFAVVAEEIRNLADRSAKATADIAAIIKALQEVAQDAVAVSTEGLRVIDETQAKAEEGGKGLRTILSGVNEATQVVTLIARAADEQRDAVRTVVSTISTTADQAKLVATATDEQSRTVSGLVQANNAVRKTAQEVRKAVAEQTRAARDIQKAAQNTREQSGQVRKATSEQVKGAEQIMRSVESMRRGTATTSRALTEQAAGSEQILRSAEGLRRAVAGVTTALGEQTTALDQIAAATENVRRQTEQTGLALKEQTGAMKEITGVVQGTASRIASITRANRDHSTGARTLVAQLGDIRQITERNATGVRQTRSGTDDLVRRAQAFRATVKPSRARNGRAGRTNGS
jgi:methyl-accepting chemotaxis protein